MTEQQTEAMTIKQISKTLNIDVTKATYIKMAFGIAPIGVVPKDQRPKNERVGEDGKPVRNGRSPYLYRIDDFTRAVKAIREATGG